MMIYCFCLVLLALWLHVRRARQCGSRQSAASGSRGPCVWHGHRSGTTPLSSVEAEHLVANATGLGVDKPLRCLAAGDAHLGHADFLVFHFANARAVWLLPIILLPRLWTGNVMPALPTRVYAFQADGRGRCCTREAFHHQAIRWLPLQEPTS